MNNFYNEYTPAKYISQSLPANKIIPRAVVYDFVKVISICYIGNGLGYREGVCESAIPLYEKYISFFKEIEIITFFNLFSDVEFQNEIYGSKIERRTRQLIELLKKQTQVPSILELLNDMLNFKGDSLRKISNDNSFVNKLKRISQSFN